MAKLEFHLQEAVDIIKKQKNNKIEDIELENEKIKLKTIGGDYIVYFDRLQDNKVIFKISAASSLAEVINVAKDLSIFKKLNFVKNLLPNFAEYKKDEIYINLNKISIPFKVESIAQKNQKIIIEGKIF